MPWSEAMTPVRMRRVAVIVPEAALRGTLVRIAEAGCVELDRTEEAASGAAAVRLQRLRGGVTTTGPGTAASAVLAAEAPDLDLLQERGDVELLAGEAQLEELTEGAVRRGEVAALTGWCPAAEVPRVAGRLSAAGGALVPLPSPRGADPPTLLRSGGPASFTPLVTTYGTPAYSDLDPSWPTGLAYVAMFGIMFGDVGHGALLVLGALALRFGRPRRLAALRRLWPFLAGAGVAAMLAGAAYGEFFGPTGLLPVLWLSPLDSPARLLSAAVVFGAGLLTVAHAAGAVNRVREHGWGTALYAASGCAGLLFYLGLALATAGLLLHRPPATVVGAALGVTGLTLVALGLFRATAGGAAGCAETAVRLFDVVVRTGTNTMSFARLAAFGLTHAALADLVWRGTTGLAGRGAAGVAGAAMLFAVGTALSFALEALVAGVQALRLEYYELFSRLFETEGRPFRPWHVPVAEPADRATKVIPCSPG
ncbi:ATPase [Streptomyces sp. NBC_00257]|uniref:V-type ATPase 116kDa subunit family protein n=1 Tax=unclassified Streptomyces TaxID=2593676 RepID=UPI00225C2F1C|nr:MULTISPECIES: V-type ATPase 116kDa subunit family protein [unclassified Streptomyces]WTB58833.1 ATPase [Streptomyces sp. NBC_00826]WTH88290.1 ATPase [Streptomyces sp. NBC_00825]WTH97018.1 ATPase [Streptomyces sp. NBC_00822]MCX4862506.1 ATPase [Streptomyces sp. NBC_00906]MCX4893743.1 ATPase [Streptomyces sp. NBC_00892]